MTNTNTIIADLQAEIELKISAGNYVLEQLASAQKQRDELLLAAEQVCGANNFTEAQIAVRVLNTIVARVKGGE